ncbi:hypothetical protein GCM10017600_08260 [Streptosporangium carneum]|uniref:Uncharacterized protein n=1 Tax=Streptosporangium carneum TaxID=47481 RepID=A0A9W6MAU1_9ACTN|nr:hypothetical protein GCM10017600_08260 [Streptosporangium carneum]
MTTVTTYSDRAALATVRFPASQAGHLDCGGWTFEDDSPTRLQAARRTRTGMGEESPIAREEAHG